MKDLWILSLVVLCATAAQGGDLAGVTMPDTIEVGDQSLVLNGMGLGKKAVIKVYVAGLYLPAKATDAGSILAADEVRRTAMEFRFGVGADKMCSAWKVGLENDTPRPHTALRANFDQLCECQADMGKDFADALLGCRIGPQPPGGAFKQGLSGQ